MLDNTYTNQLFYNKYMCLNYAVKQLDNPELNKLCEKLEWIDLKDSLIFKNELREEWLSSNE